MDPSLLSTCRHMVLHATQLGERPLAYIMNPATQQHMTDLAAVEVRPKQSALQRFLFRARKKHLILQTFMGVPILQNHYLADGFVSLQFVPRCAQMPQAQAGAPAAQEQPPASAAWPFAKQEEPRIKEAPEDAVPTLDDLAASAGNTPSVGDVLMKAFDGIDRIKQVVVIRVHNNHDVDLSLNCNQFEATGILEKARIWLAMRER